MKIRWTRDDLKQTHVEGFSCRAALAASCPLALQIFASGVDGGGSLVRGQGLLQLTLLLRGLLSCRSSRGSGIVLRHGGSLVAKPSRSQANLAEVLSRILLRNKVMPKTVTTEQGM